MFRTIAILLLSVATLGLATQPVAAQVTAEDVREAIRRGAQFLKRSRQNRDQWPEIMSYDGGVTSLCTLALLNAGFGPRDPDVAAALQYLRRLGNPESTYATSLQTMVFCAGEPERDRALILRNVKWLEEIQFREGPTAGGWGYRSTDKIPDESNTQFALLALHEAALAGVNVNPQVLRRSAAFWQQRQHPTGAWDYRGHSISGSMTCAGISSMIIINTHLRDGDAQVNGERVICCGAQSDDDTVERGIQWLARNFSVTRNPSGTRQSRPYLAYYLYGLERVGRLSGQRFIGRHDWYREGADFLVKQQNRLTGAWSIDTGYVRNSMQEINTAMALLFLSKGKRPVIVSKLQHSESIDWNRHRHDVAHLSQIVEQRWKTPVTWQNVSLQAASVDDLLQSPVLFLTGRDALRLSVSQKRLLHDYVLQGGFLLAEAACEGEAFDRGFRDLMQELFPDRELRLLPPDHPVWCAELAIPPEFARPLYGLDSCCRTSVVYCPRDLGCYWELARSRPWEYPPSVQREIDAVVGIGLNVCQRTPRVESCEISWTCRWYRCRHRRLNPWRGDPWRSPNWPTAAAAMRPPRHWLTYWQWSVSSSAFRSALSADCCPPRPKTWLTIPLCLCMAGGHFGGVTRSVRPSHSSWRTVVSCLPTPFAAVTPLRRHSAAKYSRLRASRCVEFRRTTRCLHPVIAGMTSGVSSYDNPSRGRETNRWRPRPRRSRPTWKAWSRKVCTESFFRPTI